ncbi:MAG TPA: hypothetical protein PLP48_00245 [Acholeplasmataceae bacterium]|nr:hypothetical protein [Acholeplasmataceae bacterium]
MKPVYEIIGYQLINLKYQRNGQGIPEFFKLSIKPSSFDEAKMLYIIQPIFEIKFKDSESCLFEYTAAFKINDLNWKNSMNKINLDSLFLAAVFPYIRSTVHHVTDDFRGSINLPVIDLRIANLEKGIIFEPQLNVVNKGMKN